MKKVILLSLSILLICLAYSFAEVPCKINYQGRLIKDNVPVDGTKTMRFSIHDSLQGGNELWTSGNVNVEVHNGLFRYVIGSDGGDLSGIDWTAGQELYLEVKIETDVLTPREELYAYPYAINSHLLEGATKEYFLNISGDAQTKQGNLNIMGNVGIGTASPRPWGVLTLADNLVFSEEDKDYFITGPANGGAIRLRSDGDGANRYINLGQMDNNKVFFPHLTVANGGNVGIGTTNPGEKLTVAGTIESTTGGVKFPDGTLQTSAPRETPKYTIKYKENSSLYTIGDFNSYDVIWSLPSFGSVIWLNQVFLGSYLLEMRINVTEDTTKILYLKKVDNRIKFFKDGTSVAGPWDVVGDKTIEFGLTPGQHIIQIIYNSQGGYDYLYLYGDIVDNKKVFYVAP